MSAPERAPRRWTARDLMRGPVEVLRPEMSLRAAARFLYQKQVGGAPVVDEEGRCVGVLSVTDISRWIQSHPADRAPSAIEPKGNCAHRALTRGADGRVEVRCTLPPGMCSAQADHKTPEGTPFVACLLPGESFVDWQLTEELPEDTVARQMTTEVVTVARGTPLPELAARMVGTHIHRVIVVDEESRPVGVVTSTDILAALARLPLEADFAEEELPL